MPKVLYVGDPHCRPDCIDEMGRLVKYVCKVASENHVQHILLTGDLFHTHSIVHLDVLGFWRQAFEEMSKVAKVYALVGNHDMGGLAGYNAMMLYDPSLVTIVDKPMYSPWGALMMPYYPEDRYSDFLSVCNQSPAKLVVCHQTFTGAIYENGFYAKDGIDPNLIKQDWIISGHVHSPQTLATKGAPEGSFKVWYPGSPRWQTISDANTERAIWVVDHVEGAVIRSKTAFSTADVCTPIYLLEDRPEAPVQVPSSGDICIDIYGPPDYVLRRKTEFEQAGVRVRAFPTSDRAVKVRESDGLPVAYKKFVEGFKTKHGTSSERLMELASTNVSWLRAEAA